MSRSAGGSRTRKSPAATQSRGQRIADQIQRELAELVRLEVRDPRVGLVTLTGVELSPDQSHAKVFFTDNDASLELTYVVTVKHPGGKRTVIHVHRSAEVSP